MKVPKVDVHVRRYPVGDLPIGDDDALNQWVFDRYEEKDKLLIGFEETNSFPRRAHDGTHCHKRLVHSGLVFGVATGSLAAGAGPTLTSIDAPMDTSLTGPMTPFLGAGLPCRITKGDTAENSVING